jgi:hypothetical protein
LTEKSIAKLELGTDIDIKWEIEPYKESVKKSYQVNTKKLPSEVSLKAIGMTIACTALSNIQILVSSASLISLKTK